MGVLDTEAYADAGALERVVIEAQRIGRSPRYHRGTRDSSGTQVNEQCNTDQAGKGTKVLEELPAHIRPQQLCRRCWRGTEVLAAADRLIAAETGR